MDTKNIKKDVESGNSEELKASDETNPANVESTGVEGAETPETEQTQQPEQVENVQEPEKKEEVVTVPAEPVKTEEPAKTEEVVEDKKEEEKKEEELEQAEPQKSVSVKNEAHPSFDKKAMDNFEKSVKDLSDSVKLLSEKAEVIDTLQKSVKSLEDIVVEQTKIIDVMAKSSLGRKSVAKYVEIEKSLATVNAQPSNPQSFLDEKMDAYSKQGMSAAEAYKQAKLDLNEQFASA